MFSSGMSITFAATDQHLLFCSREVLSQTLA
jgi:hypothetical protein